MSLEQSLEALQCHFTWGLESSRSKLFHLQDHLEDVGSEEGYRWLGHIHNLQGFIHHQLGHESDAHRCFRQAAEAFRQMRNTVSERGPWLVVNYGNLAWLHFHLKEPAQSQTYVSKVEALLREYPSPSPDDLHPEIYGEKGWTLMKFGFNQKLQAADYFQKAIRMQPGTVEWQTSYVFALDSAYLLSTPDVKVDISEKMRIALKHDPENLYLAALYLEKRAERGEEIGDEARELAKRVLDKQGGSYSGIRPLLRLYRVCLSEDEAIDLAEAALARHPESRYLKSCAATCYKWKIYSAEDSPLKQRLTDRAVSLHKDVIELYPHSSLKAQISLANIYAISHRELGDAQQIYDRLLEQELILQGPADAQILYSSYAKYLNFYREDRDASIEYHMKAAKIPEPSRYRTGSIEILTKIKDRNRHRKCREIEMFLEQLRRDEMRRDETR